MDIYYAYSKYLKEKYGEKVYKLPINLPGTCPNRDGNISEGGCYYCAQVGAGFESLDNSISIKDQLLSNKKYIGKRYGAKKFIAYFQNFTGTYMTPARLNDALNQSVMADIVCINISTRPDCISDDMLDMICQFKNESGIDVHLEIGLQTANYKTLEKINRGHDLAQFIDAILNIKAHGLTSSVHVIIDFEYDEMIDIVQISRIISALGVDGVKIHSLYITKNSVFGNLYETGDLKLLPEEEYISRAIAFLENLSPKIYVERLIGRVPQADSIVANFNKSWWVIKEDIEKRMADRGSYQGITCNYLNGSALNNIK